MLEAVWPPTQAQVESLVKTLFGFLSGWAVVHGYGDANLWMSLSGIVLGLVPVIWGLVRNTHASQVKQVAALPEVQSVVIVPGTKNGVGAAAADPAQPKITQG